MKVFISYSHSDEKLAKKVASILQDSGLDVWESWREIMPGDNWAAKISQELEGSDAMVVLLTPEALRSREVISEIEYALGEKNYSNRLIPVFVGPQEKLDGAGLPWILKHLGAIRIPNPDKEEESIREVAQALLNAS